MIVLLNIHKFSEDWEPSTIFYLAGFELLLDAFVFSMVVMLIKSVI